MEPEPADLASSTRGLRIASFGVLALVGAIGLGFTIAELKGSNDGPLARLLMILLVAFPYGLAAGMTWLARRSRDAVRGLLALWIVGGAVSVWLLVDAIWLNPVFLSGLIVIVLPMMQIPVVAVAGLLAWLAARSASPPSA